MNRREILQAMCMGAAGALGTFAPEPASPQNLADVDFVPDTLNLEDHARLSLNYLKGMLDEGLISAENGRPAGFPLFNAMLLLDPPALRKFAGSTGTSLSTEGLILMRLMTGDKQYADLEMEHKRLLLADARPHVYLLLSLSTWYAQTGEDQAREAIDDIVFLLWKGLIKRNGSYSLPSSDLSEFRGLPEAELQGRSIRRELAKAYAEEPLMGGHDSYPYNLDALVRIYQLTGNQSALDLAKHVTRFVVYEAGAFRDDGSFIISQKPIVNVSTAFPESAGLSPDPRGHMESRLRAVIGTLRYGIVTGDRKLIEWSRRVFDWVQLHAGSEIGWYHENVSIAEGCETCGMVCALEIAILLARSGYPDYWNIVERVSRNHLIESQLTDISWVHNLGFKGKDRPETDYAQAAERMKGGFGGWTDPMDWAGVRVRTEESPQIMNCCVTGTHALYWAWHHIVTKDEKGVWVNLALNRDTKWLRVSSYQPYQGRIDVLVHQEETVHIRVPAWVDKRTVVLQVDGENRSFDWAGSYVTIANLKLGQKLQLQYPLREFTCSESIGGRQYFVTWKGDTVLEIRPAAERWAPSPIYPLYQRQRYRTNQAEMKRVSYTVPEKEIDW